MRALLALVLLATLAPAAAAQEGAWGMTLPVFQSVPSTTETAFGWTTGQTGYWGPWTANLVGGGAASAARGISALWPF